MANTLVTAQDLDDAGFLAAAAYSDRTGAFSWEAAVGNLSGSGWTYVPLSVIGDGAYADRRGFYDNFGNQALVARSNDGNTLALAFRGTDGLIDFVSDLGGATGPLSFEATYAFHSSLVEHVLNYATTIGVSKILITGHSLGGAMVEEVLARHPTDPRLIGVSFASPGIADGDITNSPGSDTRLINVGHVDPTYPHIGSTPFTGQGDPSTGKRFQNTFRAAMCM